MIELTNVTKRFDTLTAVNNLSLTIPQGVVLGVLGPNGAGKTTLFKLIAGFITPDAGRIRPSGSEWPTIGYKPERLLFPNRLRIRQYLELVASLSNLNGSEAKQRVDESLEMVNLAEEADKKINDCSKGMRQRLGLAQTLIGSPSLLLLDEPSNGLDPEGQAEICRQIQSLNSQGRTILLASHQLAEVTQVCTSLIILNNGKLHYQNKMEGALSVRPYATIRVDKPLEPMVPVLTSLHPEIGVDDNEIILNKEAMTLRRQILSILIGAGYDILKVEQNRVTLAEIYAEAIR
ncbi:MAG: ABC transporter ATP-binding protein [Candidatus Promineifilaceae bacterium]